MPDGSYKIEEYADLPFSEQMMVWAIRMWVKGYRDDAQVHDLIAEGFSKINAEKGAVALDQLMSIVATGAKETVDVRCPQCAELSADEHRLIGVIAAWQCTGLGDPHDSLLGRILQPAAVRIARAPAYDLAMSLKYAGLLIRPRRDYPATKMEHEPYRQEEESIVH